MNDTKNSKEKDRRQHVQVFVRVRPINESEKNNKSKNVIEILNNKELAVHERHNDKFSKKYKFDRVFGPLSKQIELYDVVISPLLEQVLAGYNCTVFAYGQTGTGKTFTMEGNPDFSSTLNWQTDSPAGMIPRALSHLMDKLQSLEAQEYNVRVSFLELYNEELYDLLSANGDRAKIRLYEDVSKKGGVIIHGLEEVTIKNKNEVYKILERGSERRQTSATLMNNQSSRSHTVFSIMVHMKENTIGGEEVLKTGKLNLVDLAGSENVGRSGAVDKRAREASNINQSLLTLGRVITALVERAPHIPYRESKLTRLLQESLGGRTKTSIIATISPASVNIEETISTLDYTHRAKNIKNRPEINQRLSKSEFLKQYAEEIKKLKRDLWATRERTGVYLADENYRELLSLISEQSKEIEAKINHIKALETAVKDKERIFHELELQNIEQTKKLQEVKTKLNHASAALDTTDQRLKLSAQERDEQKYLVEKYLNTEKYLLNQGETLLNVANTATEDFYKLQEKIARKNETEQALEAESERFQNNVCEHVQRIQNNVLAYSERFKECFTSMKSELDMETFFKCENMQQAVNQLSTVLPEEHLPDTDNLASKIEEFYSALYNEVQSLRKDGVTTMESEHELLSKKYLELEKSIDDMIDNNISTNLMAVRNMVSEELIGTSETINEIIDTSCEQQLKIYNETCELIRNNKENVKTVREALRSTEKQRCFEEMITNVYSQFNDLKMSEEEHYNNVRENCDRLDELYNDFNDLTTDSYNANVETRSELREHIRQGIEQIENDVLVNTKQSEEHVEQIAEQGVSLINEIKSNVNESSEMLREYKNKLDAFTIEIQSQMDKDKCKTLSLIKDSQAAIVDMCKTQAASMNNTIIEISDATKATSEELETRMKEFIPWSHNVVEELQQLQGEICKFFTQDIQRDVPTGTTPSKKEFSYPRQFTATSPHERILQRFREARKFAEGPELNEDSFMIGDTPLRHIANSTELFDSTLTNSPTENTVLNANESSIYASIRNSMDSTVTNVTSTSDSSSVSANSNTVSHKKNQ